MDTDEGDSQSESELESEEEENTGWMIDIWDMLNEKTKGTNLSINAVYRYYVVLVKSFKYDKTHQKIMETLKRARDEELMDFPEALDYAINKRSFLIKRQNDNNEDEDEDDEDDDVEDATTIQNNLCNTFVNRLHEL